MTKFSGTKGRKRANGSAFNSKVPVPRKPRVKKLPESWRADQRRVAMNAVSIAAYLVQEGGVPVDQIDNFRNQNLIARIATEPHDDVAQKELEQALQRRAAG